MEELLSLKKSKNTRTCEKILAIIRENYDTNAKLLQNNPYEYLANMSFWYTVPGYQVSYITQNEQILRLRFYSEKQLSHVMTSKNPGANNLISKISANTTIYQPVYPETFYGFYEWANLFLPKRFDYATVKKNYLFISDDEKQGCAEAFMIHAENTHVYYQKNRYDCWVAGSETYNRSNDSYDIPGSKTHALSQSFDIAYLSNTNQLHDNYDFIVINSISHMDSPTIWRSEQYDLSRTLFYLSISKDNLSEKGSILVRMNMLSGDSWSMFTWYCTKLFGKFTFYRPSINNRYNPEIFMHLSGKKCSEMLPMDLLMRSVYVENIFSHMSFAPVKNNQLYRKLVNESKKMLSDIPCEKKCLSECSEMISKWCDENGLEMISTLPNYKSIVISLDQKIKRPRHRQLYEITERAAVSDQQMERLYISRSKLNMCKRSMDTRPSRMFRSRGYDRNEEYITWETMNQMSGHYRYLKHNLEKTFKAEVTTNAWTKLYEILEQHKLLKNKKIKSFHICEAPGAFICATNHYCATNGIELDWKAQTLRPTEANREILSDHYGLIESHPHRWFYGPDIDSTGDITDSRTTRYYFGNPDIGEVDFMTADGGAPVHPSIINEQESVLSRVFLGQIICIMACLKQGGSAVMKMFLPMAKPLNISIIYMMAKMFDTIKLVKPVMSRPINSEFYVVAESYNRDKYIGNIDFFIDLLDQNITCDTWLFSAIPDNFMESYADSITNLTDNQSSSLKNLYRRYYSLDITSQDRSPDTKSDKWIRDNKIKVLPPTMRISNQKYQ